MEDDKKLFVGNLPYTVTSEELKNLFSEFGEITEAVVIMDREKNRSKGFGFVTFATSEDANKAKEAMNGKDAGGRQLIVNVARPLKPRE